MVVLIVLLCWWNFWLNGCRLRFLLRILVFCCLMCMLCRCVIVVFM